MIDIRNVSFGYAREGDTLKNINLHIAAGECVLLCGKSGCGKTTLTKLVNGLIPHFTENGRLEGTVVAAGMEVARTELYELSKRIGSVFQNPKSQFFNLDSDAELAFGLENIGASPELMKKRLRDTVEELKIARLEHRSIFTMSGGEKQALAFASVYAMNPDIYVLDEPTANLDAEAIAVLKRQLGEIKRQGKTILIAEHRLHFLTGLIDRAVYMEDGEIVRIYTREEFLALPEERRVKMGLRTLRREIRGASVSAPCKDGRELEVRELCCELKGSRIIDRVSFSARGGEVLGITGGNGAGKSTLMRCLAGLLKEKSGAVLLGGKALKPRRRTGACFCVMQDVNHQLFSDSVWNECELSVADGGGREIERVLTAFDLQPWKESHPMALSGGQKQRLAIASGVLTDRRVLIFDEPTSGLDYEHMLAAGRMIKKLAEDGHIVLVVTHDTEFLDCACDRIITLTADGAVKEA